MPTVIVSRPRRNVNPVPKSFEEIYQAWWRNLAAESFIAKQLRGGVARQRTKLLDGVPSWRLPEILDRLGEAAI